MNDFNLRDIQTICLPPYVSIMLKRCITLKFDKTKSQKQYIANLTASQQYSAILIKLGKTYVTLYKSKGFLEIVCKSSKEILQVTKYYEPLFSLLLIDYQTVLAIPTNSPGNYSQPIQFSELSIAALIDFIPPLKMLFL